jgi:Na+-transporting methylmalonyl-CoA/oxaloacetate decarboxylase gamma subunit
MPLFSDLYVAVVLIFMIVLAAACYAVRRLESRPARLVSVLTALAFLVGALVPVVRILSESAPRPTEVVAPPTSGTTTSPAVSPDMESRGPSPTALSSAGGK